MNSKLDTRLLFILILFTCISSIYAQNSAPNEVQMIAAENPATGKIIYERFGGSGEIVTDNPSEEEAEAMKDAGVDLQGAGSGDEIQKESISAWWNDSDYKTRIDYRVESACVIKKKLTIWTRYKIDGGSWTSWKQAGSGNWSAYTGWYEVYIGPNKKVYFEVKRKYEGTLCNNTKTYSATSKTTVLRAPKSLTAKPNGSDKFVDLAWTKASNIPDKYSNSSSYQIGYYIYKNDVYHTYTTARSYKASTTPGSDDKWAVRTRFHGYSSNPAVSSGESGAATSTTANFKPPANFTASDDTTVGYVRVKWNNESDYATNVLLYRDDVQIATVAPTLGNYLDTLATPGTVHAYSAVSFNNATALQSESVSDNGREFHFAATDGTENDRVKLDWTDFSDPNFAAEVRIERDGGDSKVFTASQTNYDDKDALPGKVYRYSITALDDNRQPVLVATDYGFRQPNGQVRGTVKTPGATTGGGVQDVSVYAWPTSDTLSHALSLDGQNDYARVPYAPDLSLQGNFTIEMWARLQTTNTIAVLLNKRINNDNGTLNYQLQNSSDGTFRFYTAGTANKTKSTTIARPNEWTHIAGVQDAAANKLRLYINGVLEQEVDLTDADITNGGPLLIGRDEVGRYLHGDLDEIRIWNTARSDSAIKTDMFHMLTGAENGLVAYWPFNGSSTVFSGDYAYAGGHHAEIFGGAALGSNKSGLRYSALTDDRGEGAFLMEGIYYSTGSEFAIAPLKEDHGFDTPDTLFRTLRNIAPDGWVANASFTDTTSFSISGRVMFSSHPACGVSGVQILINNKLAGVTDQLGAFSVAVPQAGTYTLKPVRDGHTFNPAQQNITVTNFVEGIEFLDPTTSTLVGLVSGGCETFLGIGTVRLQSLDANGCFDKTFATDGSGHYSIEVPAQAYAISLDAINNPDESMILDFFNKDTLDLTASDITKDFEYHAPPEIKITGPYAVGCGDFTGVPIMRQLRTDTLDIEIFERYTYNGKETICFVDSGDVLLRDAIADGQVDQNFVFKNGKFRYAVTPGMPNILADDPAHPYQKLLSMQVTTPFYTENDSLWAVVTGHKPRPGEPFSTVTPQVPIMVLHDPPGDQSYSYLEKESTQFINIGMSFGVDGSLTQFSNAKVGGGFDIPFVGSGGAYAKVSRSLEVGASLNSEVEVGLEISATERFNTSNDQEVTGSDGDVFIGGAINMKYGITDVLAFIDCGIDLSQAVVWGGDGFATRYIYTENYVRTSLLPELQYLADHAGSADKAARFLDAIEVWTQVLALNEQNKSTAPITKPNISFSGNLGTEESETITQSLTGSIEFNVYIENSVAVSAGVTVGDFNEAEAGVEARIRFDFGASVQAGTRQRNTTGYYLGDDDAGDDFSVNIRGDATYGTPVFELIAGTSSNPWEGLPSQPRDGVALSITPPVQDNVPPTQAAIYELRLFNTSPSNETRDYLLDLVQASNPGGARLRIGDQFVDKLRYTIPAGDFQQVTLDVSRLAGHPFDYENLKLRFYAENDPQFADTVAFSARFVKPCSEITLAFPQPGWRINQVSGETVPVALSDFDGSSGSLQNLRLEYSEDETDWTLIDTFSGDALLTDTLKYAWDVSQIPNGAYLLRAVAVCNSGENYSLISDGYIDRSAWSVDLRITDGGGIGTGERLTFGQSSVAGPGLDDGIGEAELPPPPPSGVFYAGFQLPAANAGASLCDFRHSDELNLVWDITLQPGVGGFPMLLSWNPAMLPAGDFYLQDNITGDIVNVDMKQQASFLLENSAVTSLKIDFVSSFQCQTLNVDAGWNILSVPLTSNDMFANNVFPEATSKAFTFAEGYRADELLHSGTGYWLKFPANDTLEFCGREANSNEMALKEGWNLVGPFAEDIAVADVQTTPDGIISSQFFGYNNGYAVAEHLQAGKGYWVRIAQDGLMRFAAPANAPAPALTKSGSHNAQIASIDGAWGTIRIIDNAHSSATLYAANRDIDTEIFTLPPAPPAGIFDARYSEGTFVAPLQEQEHDIILNAAQFPVTITALGLDLQLTDAVTGELLNTRLKNGESLVLKNAALTRLRVREIAIPDQYVLHQNYPNPFNPQTTIAFDLPDAGTVSVVIYNTIGQEVARIANGRLEAGTHTFTFDARNLASGVYFVRMHAGPFTAVKKMLLLR